MAEALFIPKLGQTVEEVTLLNWLVNDGDKVDQGQEVLEVETDKAVFNVEATDTGFIHIGPYKPGQVVPVLEVVATIGSKDEKFHPEHKSVPMPSADQSEAISSNTQSLTKPQVMAPVLPVETRRFSSPRARKLAAEKHIALDAIQPTGGSGVRVRESDILSFLAAAPKANPVAAKIALEAKLDLRSVRPSGARGEITRADVEFALARRADNEQASDGNSSAVLPLSGNEVSTIMPLKGIRGVIADRMSQSSRTTARVTLFMDVDATALVALREKLKTAHETEWGFAPGYNELIAKACAISLRNNPHMNARINNNQIEQLAHINIGIAVDAEKGLFVPVIRDTDAKDIKSIRVELRKYVNQVRSGKVLPEVLEGGTFTITNLGMFDVDGFTPVINLPEAAILGIGRILPKPVVKEGQIVIRNMLTLSLVFDHRLVDGAPAARFLQHLKEILETPETNSLAY